MAAVIGNQVDAGVSRSGEALAAMDEGQVKPLVVFNDERLDDMPDVPTAAEAGLGDLEFGGWGGIYGPKDIPSDVVSTLESAISEALESEDYEQTVTNSGNLVVHKDAEAHDEFVHSEYERFAELLG